MLVVLAMLVPLEDSDNEGRFGEDRVGLIDDGGVMELWEDVSIVEEDLPETTSTLVEGDLESVVLKLALDRRRSCLKKGIGMRPGTSRQQKNQAWGRERERASE